MCGRYSLKTDNEALSKRFNAEPPQTTSTSRYNISPTQSVPVIRNTRPNQIELAS